MGAKAEAPQTAAARRMALKRNIFSDVQLVVLEKVSTREMGSAEDEIDTASVLGVVTQQAKEWMAAGL